MSFWFVEIFLLQRAKSISSSGPERLTDDILRHPRRTADLAAKLKDPPGLPIRQLENCAIGQVLLQSKWSMSFWFVEIFLLQRAKSISSSGPERLTDDILRHPRTDG